MLKNQLNYIFQDSVTAVIFFFPQNVEENTKLLVLLCGFPMKSNLRGWIFLFFFMHLFNCSING